MTLPYSTLSVPLFILYITYILWDIFKYAHVHNQPPLVVARHRVFSYITKPWFLPVHNVKSAVKQSAVHGIKAFDTITFSG